MTDLPTGFHPDDIWHVLSDGLGALDHLIRTSGERAGEPWTEYTTEPTTDPKCHEDGYREVMAIANRYVTDRLDRSEPATRREIDGPPPQVLGRDNATADGDDIVLVRCPHNDCLWASAFQFTPQDETPAAFAVSVIANGATQLTEHLDHDHS